MKRGLGGPVFGRLERQLRDLARSTYTLGQIEAALTVVDAHRTHDGTRPGVPLKVSMLAGALESPGVRALADEA